MSLLRVVTWAKREISPTPIGNENETHFIIAHVEPRDLTTGEANKYFGLGSRMYKSQRVANTGYERGGSFDRMLMLFVANVLGK